jgi:hypothetical protein
VLVVATAVAQHSCCHGLADIVVAVGVVVAGAEGEVVAANSDRATAGESVGLRRPVLVAVVGARALAV